MWSYELTVILVGGHHVGVITLGGRARGQSAYHVVSFIAGHLDDRDAVALEYALYIRYGQSDVLGLLVALGFIGLKLLVAECAPVGRVETYCYVRGILLAQQIVKSVAEAKYGRRVESRGRCKPRRVNQRVVGAVYKGVGVQ